MLPTTFQPGEIYNSSGALIRAGAFGPNTPFYKDDGNGVYDYIVNDLEFLYKLAQAEIVPVTTLPASGDPSKTYLVTYGADAGKCFIWTGTIWQELSSADIVDQAEAAVADAADLLRQVQALIAASTVDSLWNASTAYDVGDCVMTTDGATWRCVQACTNQPPATSPAYWSSVTVAAVTTFEFDGNGDIVPAVSPVASANWDIDSNGDIEPVA